jgi:hypothetical protein
MGAHLESDRERLGRPFEGVIGLFSRVGGAVWYVRHERYTDPSGSMVTGPRCASAVAGQPGLALPRQGRASGSRVQEDVRDRARPLLWNGRRVRETIR